MADYETVDITSELLLIANDPHGKTVKDAIYRALDKLNQAKSGPGPGPGPEPEPPTGHFVPTGVPSFKSRGVVGGFAGSVDGSVGRAYIQSNGNQGIDTGFTPSSTKVRYEIEFADFVVPTGAWGTMFGGYNYYSYAQPGVLAGKSTSYNGNMVFGIGDNDTYYFTDYNMPRNWYHKYVIDIDGTNASVTIDDSTLLSTTFVGSIECPVGLCCGIKYQNGVKTVYEKSTVKIYSFKIYENDTLVKDFIPALGENDRPGFYENVSEEYYYSETGTDFTYVPAST